MMGRDVLFVRNERVDQLRLNDTVNQLRQGDFVVRLGHSGIGKSVESNYILTQFLRHLGKEGWPERVVHQLRHVMLVYALNSHGNVECHAGSGSNHLDDLHNYCFDAFHRGRPRTVLFLELKSSELDPDPAGVPTFLTVSGRPSDTVLKTLTKSCSLAMHWVRPHALDETHLIGRVLLDVDRPAMLKRLGLGAETEDGHALEALRQRAETVGPLRWQVLQHPAVYRNYLDEMHSLVDGVLLSLGSVTYDNHMVYSNQRDKNKPANSPPLFGPLR